ncbi:MAG: hypothetical protein PVI35_07540, partial [Acidimicrobiia bacterium]
MSHRWAFRGIDPEDLGLLSARMQHRSEILDVAGRRGASALREHGLVAESAALGRAVSGVAASLAEAAGDTRWRAAAIRSAQDTTLAAALPILAWRLVVEEAEFAATVACRPEDREATLRDWRASPSPEALTGLAPSQVAAAFSGLSPLARDGFAHRFPEVAAGLEGAPAEVRYLANRLRIADRVADLEDRLASLRDRFAPEERPALQGEIDRVEGRVRELRCWLAEERQILWFDPAGDG